MRRAARGFHETSFGLKGGHSEVGELDVEFASIFVLDQQEVLKLDIAMGDVE